MTRKELLDEAMRLEPGERAQFIQDLHQSTLPDEFDSDQLAQVRRRIEEIEQSRTLPLEGPAVIRDARERVRQQRAL